MAGSPKCPRCGAPVTGAADDLGFLSCGGCGARLRKAPTVKVTIQSPSPTSGSSPVPAASAPPPTPSGNRDTTDSLLARIERVDASATLPPGVQSSQALKAAGFPPALPAAPKNEGMDGLKSILQAIQKDMAILKQSHQDLAAVVAKFEVPRKGAAPSPSDSGARPKTAPSAMKPVLILDDDDALADQTRKACEKMGFAPVVVADARAALDAMGRERPALLIIEPMLTGGELSGKDLVNYVKSTMEWIEIPILVHTRAEIVNHEQARTDYGADDYVLKAAGSVDLLAKKIARLTS